MRSRPFSAALAVLSFAVTALTPLSAAEYQTMTTEAGDHLRGECAGVADGVLTWRTAYGDSIRVPVSAISELTCAETWDLQFSDGQTLRGQWSVAQGTLTLRSAVFGMLHCPVGQLLAGVRAVSARGLTDEKTATPPPPPEPAAPASGASDAPPSSLQTMLRQSSILLRPGTWSLATGINYTHDRVVYSPNDTRQLSVSGQLQRGFTPRVEGAIEWPAYWTHTATTAVAGAPPTVTTSNSTKLQAGNPEVSATTLLASEGRVRPECVAVAGLTIPVNAASEGGLFRSRIGLEFLKTSDPGALFAGFAWLRDGEGWQTSPYRARDYITYHVGAAIGLNDELAVGLQAQGAYLTELRAKNGTLLSPSQEPVQARFWFNFRISQQNFMETSVLFPMSSDSHATTFGLTYIRRF